MMPETDSRLIQLLEQLEQSFLEKDQFIEFLEDFEEADIQTLQQLLKIVYSLKSVIEGPPPPWGLGGTMGAGRPGPSGPGVPPGSGRPGGSRRGRRS